MAQTKRGVATLEALVNIMNKRVLVSESMIGKRVKLTVQGDGNIMDVMRGSGDDKEPVQSLQEEGTVLQKKIFNTKARTSIGTNNARNKEYLVKGIAAEKAGNSDEAAEHYNDYLNATQFSFNILLPSKTADKISNGCEVAGRVEKVTTDNGSLLTFEAGTISIVEPESLAIAEFSAEDLLGVPYEGRTETPPTEG